MTQTETILRLLRERGSRGITAMDALQLAGSFRLAARINDLRAAGYDVRTTMVATRDGRMIARYWLVEPVASQQTLRL
jgi:hypothetical protein